VTHIYIDEAYHIFPFKFIFILEYLILTLQRLNLEPPAFVNLQIHYKAMKKFVSTHHIFISVN